MKEILELQSPKPQSMVFKVSKEDKAEIIKFCEDKGFRMSAFLRVAVQSHMQTMKDEDEN